MSRRLNKFYYAEDNDMIRDTLRRASTLCKKLSIHSDDNTEFGDDCKAFHEVVDSIFQFCVRSNSSDTSDENMDAAIIHPYRDISDLSSRNVESHSINQLILWSEKDI